MTAPDLHGDDGLEAALRRAMRGHDEAPPEAVAAAVAAFDLGHLEGELAELISDSAVDGTLVGVRDDGPSEDRVLTFGAGSSTIDLDLPGDEEVLLGHLDPPGPTEVVVEVADPAGGSSEQVVPVDDLGRFRWPLEPGSFRVRVRSADGPILTPWISR